MSNAGAGATNGTVTVSDTLPSALTATGLSGTGWTCTVALCVVRGAMCWARGELPTNHADGERGEPGAGERDQQRDGERRRKSNTANNTATDITSISATTGDTEPPSIPGHSPSAVALSGTSIVLNLGAATDNVGVTGYRVERCDGVGCSNFIKLSTANPTGTSLTDTGLFPNTSYSYLVRAVDAADIYWALFERGHSDNALDGSGIGGGLRVEQRGDRIHRR